MKKKLFLPLALLSLCLQSCEFSLFFNSNDKDKDEKAIKSFSCEDLNKDNYKIGESFASFIDNGGLSVTLTYNDDTSEKVSYLDENGSSTNYTVTLSNNQSIDDVFTTPGSYTVTVSVGDLSAYAYQISVNEGEETTVKVTGVTLSPTSKTLYVGDSFDLTATVSPSNATNKNVSWMSSNQSVATVNDGHVTAVSQGTATITVLTEDSSKMATCSVTINNRTVSVTGVSLSETSKTLYIGDTFDLTATVAPNDATNKNVTWTSSNNSVASVSNGKVTAVAQGSAIISVKTIDGDKTATCSVTVNKKVDPVAESIEIKETTACSYASYEGNHTISNYTYYAYNVCCATSRKLQFKKSSGYLKNVTAKEIKTITIKDASGILTVSAGTSSDSLKTVTGNNGVYNLNGVSYFMIKNGTGSAITVSSIKIEFGIIEPVDPAGISIPSSLNLHTGNSETLTVTYTPSNVNRNKEINWTTSDSSIATVNNGVVTAVKAGNAIITATSTYNSNLKSSCNVTITDVNVTSVSLDATTFDLGVGGTKQLTATILPSDATNQGLTWTSSDTNVAAVSKTGLVTALGLGTATITVKTSDGNKTASCAVNVVDKPVYDYDWTIMIYMCGSTLEYDPTEYSQSYLASADIEEILSVSNLSSKVKIIIETGGSQKWGLSSSKISGGKTKISNTNLQRWEVKDKKLNFVEDLNTNKMSLESSVESFLNWGLEDYSAENMGVIFWNHGGGIAGVCSDENYTDEDDYGISLSTADIANASKNALETNNRDKFSFIGYDACLMGCADIASVNADYYDYMVASQEVEAGSGWDYDTWIKTINSNTKSSPLTVCDKIASSFVEEQEDSCPYFGETCNSTLAVYDLSKAGAFITAFNNYVNSISLSKNNVFNAFKKSLGFGIDYGASLYGLADFNDFINKMSSYYTSSYKDTLINAVNNMVVKNYYCKNKYKTTKPCGINVFTGLVYNAGYYGLQVPKSFYQGSMNSKLSKWQTFVLNNASFDF